MWLICGVCASVNSALGIRQEGLLARSSRLHACPRPPPGTGHSRGSGACAPGEPASTLSYPNPHRGATGDRAAVESGGNGAFDARRRDALHALARCRRRAVCRVAPCRCRRARSSWAASSRRPEGPPRPTARPRGAGAAGVRSPKSRRHMQASRQSLRLVRPLRPLAAGELLEPRRPATRTARRRMGRKALHAAGWKKDRRPGLTRTGEPRYRDDAGDESRR